MSTTELRTNELTRGFQTGCAASVPSACWQTPTEAVSSVNAQHTTQLYVSSLATISQHSSILVTFRARLPASLFILHNQTRAADFND